MKNEKLVRVTVFLLALVLSPNIAFANVGTPLLWVGTFHLLIGNALIGLGEGLLLARWFSAPKQRAVQMMVGANYISMIVGLLAIAIYGDQFAAHVLGDRPLYRVGKLIFIAGVLSFVMTILLEWPFCFWILRSGVGRALKASLVVQTVSYSVLAPFYLWAGQITLISRTHLEQNPSFASCREAMVYFISPQDAAVYRIRLDGTEREKILSLGDREKNSRLFARKSEKTDLWDLWVKPGGDKTAERVLIRDFARLAASPARGAGSDPTERDTWRNFGSAPDLQVETNRLWKVRAGFWAAQGLDAEDQITKQTVRFALETPFVNWNVRNATVLPGGQVVFQLDQQILLLDLNTRQLALLALGRGPVVALDPKPSNK